MLGHGGSSAGLYLADPTSPIPSQCCNYPVSKCPSASIVATSTLRVNLHRHGSVLTTAVFNLGQKFKCLPEDLSSILETGKCAFTSLLFRPLSIYQSPISSPVHLPISYFVPCAFTNLLFHPLHIYQSPISSPAHLPIPYFVPCAFTNLLFRPLRIYQSPISSPAHLPISYFVPCAFTSLLFRPLRIYQSPISSPAHLPISYFVPCAFTSLLFHPLFMMCTAAQV